MKSSPSAEGVGRCAMVFYKFKIIFPVLFQLLFLMPIFLGIFSHIISKCLLGQPFASGWDYSQALYYSISSGTEISQPVSHLEEVLIANINLAFCNLSWIYFLFLFSVEIGTAPNLKWCFLMRANGGKIISSLASFLAFIY